MGPIDNGIDDLKGVVPRHRPAMTQDGRIDEGTRCKEVLVMQGILKHAHMRPPLVPVGADDRKRLKQALEEAGEL